MPRKVGLLADGSLDAVVQSIRHAASGFDFELVAADALCLRASSVQWNYTTLLNKWHEAATHPQQNDLRSGIDGELSSPSAAKLSTVHVKPHRPTA